MLLDALDRRNEQAHFRDILPPARPLQAHCRLGPGKLCRRTGDQAQAQHLVTATATYREMDMGFRLHKAEAELGPPLRTP
jgi:hypothetical protein